MMSDNQKRICVIWRFGKRYIPMFAVAEICILVSYAVSVLLPLNFARLTDDVLYGGEYALLPEVIRNYIYLFVTAAVFNTIYAFVWQYLNNHYVLDVKNKMFERIIFAKASFLSGMNSGDIMDRIDGDADQFIHIIQRNLFHFTNSVIMCLGIVIVVARLNLTISIMLVVAACLPVVITRLFGGITEKYSRESRKASGLMTGKLYEVIKGFREIKLFGAEKFAYKWVFAPMKCLISIENKKRSVDFQVNKLIRLVNLFASIIVYCFSVHLVVRGELTIGIFVTIIEYITLLHRKFNWILKIYLDWFNRKASIDRVNEVFDLEEETQEGKDILSINRVEFRDVRFAYENGNMVLNKFNLIVNKGEKLGLVGFSGNGKTTVVSLLLGLYSPNDGLILINDTPISEIKPAALRNRIGIVSQDIMLFEDTIKYNLMLGNEYSDDELFEALDAVGLTETIEKLPEGINTVIGPAAHNLSGGQKQRLMIARMLLKKPDLIVLDEATSALDVETEKAVVNYLLGISNNTTMLVISHRLEAIKSCDKIIVMNDNRIVDIGTHDKLVSSSQIYYELFG